MTKPTLLLETHLKALRLPTFLREYDKVARHCAQEGLDCPRYLFRLCELELLDREQRATERRIKAAKFPVLKSLETFEFRAIPSVNKRLVLELTRSEYLDRRENVLALGNSGTGKTHLALALGLAACQKGYRVRFTTAAALVNDLLEARDDQAPAAVAEAARQAGSVDRRRARLCAVVEDRRRAALRDLLPALRASVDARDLESALQRIDRDLRVRTPHRRAARSTDPPRPHPGAERRELSPRTQQESPPARGHSNFLKPPRAAAFRNSDQLRDGLVFLRHGGLILLRP